MPGALQAAHHDDGGRLGRHLQFRIFGAHELDQLVVDDFDDLLRGIERGEDLLPHRLFRNVGDKLLGDLEIDVRFQQRHAHLAHRRFDFQLRQLTALGELGKYMIEPFRKRCK